MSGTLSLPAGALAASDPLRRGLVGWYRMQGDVNDHSGKGNNGTLVNGPLAAMADKYGNSTGAYNFVYATHQYITLANSNPLYSTSSPGYSVAAWIKSPSAYTEFLYCDFSSTNGFAQFGIHPSSTNKLTVYVKNSSGTNILNATSTTTCQDNTWHHVVWSDNAGTAAVYIDGALDATNFNYTPGSLGVTLNRSSIGADQNGNSQWAGGLCDVRLYNRALSAADAHTLYAAIQRI